MTPRFQELGTDRQISLDRSVEADLDEHSVHEIASDIAYKRLMIVNVVYLGSPDAANGHGCSWTRDFRKRRAMRGPVMRSALDLLASDFDRIALPEHGRYVHRSSHDGDVGGLDAR